MAGCGAARQGLERKALGGMREGRVREGGEGKNEDR
jgi:hypothetical protein